MDATQKPHGKDWEDELFDDADICTTPFAEQTPYGYGLWKRPIKFVKAAPVSSPPPPPAVPKATSVADQYRAIVFPNGQPQPKTNAYPLCGVCGAPVKEGNDRIHFLSLVHQSALPPTHTPSGIDRTRMGLKYLEKHGFDVDARIGLGANGEGRLFPIIPKEKKDKYGLGVDKKQIELATKERLVPKDDKLDARKMRKLAVVEKKKHEKLQKLFYGDDKVERYLEGKQRVDHGLK